MSGAWSAVRGGALRQAFFWAHLGLGLAVGLVILVLAGTGMVMAFEDQLLAFAERKVARSASGSEQAPLPLDRLTALVLAETGAKEISAITAERDPRAAWRFQVGRDRSVLVDPYQGRVLGPGADALHAWLHKAESLHRWFLLEGKGREAAKQVKNAANAAFVLILASGLVLWWPERWNRKAVKAVALPSLKLEGKARDYNWHNSLGLLFWPGIFAISLSGLVLSYAWAESLLYRAAGEKAPARPPAQARPAGAPQAPVAQPPWQAYFDAAATQVPSWIRISARQPRPGQGDASLTVVMEDLPPPRGRGTLSVDAKTGAIKKWAPYQAESRGRKLRLWARWTHTGQSLGLAGQIAAFLCAAAIAVLAYTGLALSWRRFLR